MSNDCIVFSISSAAMAEGVPVVHADFVAGDLGDPSGEALAVEKGDPLLLVGVGGLDGRCGPGGRRAEEEQEQAGCRLRLYSMSNDCIVFSISSAAMSEVDWMPWIFSLNSSGLLARRRASS